jgi:hypothetical protein
MLHDRDFFCDGFCARHYALHSIDNMPMPVSHFDLLFRSGHSASFVTAIL